MDGRVSGEKVENSIDFIALTSIMFQHLLRAGKFVAELQVPRPALDHKNAK